MTPAQLVRAALDASGLTDADFCRVILAGRDTTTLYRWLRGASTPSASVQAYLRAYLDGIVIGATTPQEQPK